MCILEITKETKYQIKVNTNLFVRLPDKLKDVLII